eukprot:TRINITY_DN17320_c0_g1_i1.p1 TRINITY_DN17320_c0_g1~~TRINITY_DN17320_c0_g1_i1.p1  ORF type:complete len:241 (-),score=21.91 TRINITY_DN17320_c0_g1_i1:192-914(-)
MDQDGDIGSTGKAVRLVCISDTHACHRDLVVPDGDVLIHAGDWTRFGRREHADDFNDWLGSLPHKHKLVVDGNHEANAPWKDSTASLLTNATFLRNTTTVRCGLRFHGTQFSWPVAMVGAGVLTYAARIPSGVDVVVAHGPPLGYVDGRGGPGRGGGGGCGCADLARHLARTKPQLLVCGHIHGSHGMQEGTDRHEGTRFVNAAICGEGAYKVAHAAVVVDMVPRPIDGDPARDKRERED